MYAKPIHFKSKNTIKSKNIGISTFHTNYKRFDNKLAVVIKILTKNLFLKIVHNISSIDAFSMKLSNYFRKIGHK